MRNWKNTQLTPAGSWIQISALKIQCTFYFIQQKNENIVLIIPYSSKYVYYRKICICICQLLISWLNFNCKLYNIPKIMNFLIYFIYVFYDNFFISKNFFSEHFKSFSFFLYTPKWSLSSEVFEWKLVS